MSTDDPRILGADELEAIARRVAREPVYSEYNDCSQAFADRRHLMSHLLALQAAGGRALAAIAGHDVLDLDAARRLARARHDAAGEGPDV